MKILSIKLARIKHIGVIMFRELVRDNVFLSLSGAAMVLVFASLILNEMVVGQQIKATKDLGLSVLNLFSLFILIFLGVNLISRDLGNKSLYLLFSRPVSRGEYLIGSGLSVLAAVIAGIVVIMGTIFLLSALQGEWWWGGLLSAGYLTLLEMMILLAFAILFVLLTSPQLAMFLTLLMYVIGHALQNALQIVGNSTNVGLKYCIVILHALLPNLDYFNKKPEITYQLPIPFSYWFHATGYALAYTILIYIIAVQVFKHKEL